jgi:hypothetical protein
MLCLITVSVLSSSPAGQAGTPGRVFNQRSPDAGGHLVWLDKQAVEFVHGTVRWSED